MSCWICIGQNYWAKNEYDARECIMSWLDLSHKDCGGVSIVQFDCDPDKIEIDQISGTVYTPKGTKKLQEKQVVIEEISGLMTMLERREILQAKTEEIEYDIAHKFCDGLDD